MTPRPTFKLSIGYCILLLLFGIASWAAFQSLQDAYKKLADLPFATGPIQSAQLKYKDGKNGYYYIEFRLANQPNVFGLRTQMLAGPADSALQHLRTNSKVFVYYEESFLHSDINFDLYQVATSQRVIYSLNEARHRNLTHFTFALLAAALSLVFLLRYHLA